MMGVQGNTSTLGMMKSETNVQNRPGNRKMHIESSYIWDLNQVQHLSRKKRKHFRESLQEITSSASDFSLVCFLGACSLINIIAWHLDSKYIPEYKLDAQLDLLSLCIYCSELPAFVSGMLLCTGGISQTTAGFQGEGGNRRRQQ